jgi:hypothetical protein
MSDRRGALEAIDRVLNRGGDADDVLRAVRAVRRRTEEGTDGPGGLRG